MKIWPILFTVKETLTSLLQYQRNWAEFDFQKNSAQSSPLPKEFCPIQSPTIWILINSVHYYRNSDQSHALPKEFWWNLSNTIRFFANPSFCQRLFNQPSPYPHEFWPILINEGIWINPTCSQKEILTTPAIQSCLLPNQVTTSPPCFWGKSNQSSYKTFDQSHPLWIKFSLVPINSEDIRINVFSSWRNLSCIRVKKHPPPPELFTLSPLQTRKMLSFGGSWW